MYFLFIIKIFWGEGTEEGIKYLQYLLEKYLKYHKSQNLLFWLCKMKDALKAK